MWAGWGHVYPRMVFRDERWFFKQLNKVRGFFRQRPRAAPAIAVVAEVQSPKPAPNKPWVVMTLFWFFWLLLTGTGLLASARSALRERPFWPADKLPPARAGNLGRRCIVSSLLLGGRPPGFISRAGLPGKWACWALPWRFRHGDTG
jgi:hypothetical protein